MHLVGKVWRHIPTKLQIYPTCNYGVRPLEHKVSVYGIHDMMDNKKAKPFIQGSVLDIRISQSYNLKKDTVKIVILSRYRYPSNRKVMRR